MLEWNGLGIRAWKHADREPLLYHLRQYLSEDHKEYGSELLPTTKNVELMWRIGIRSVQDGCPTLLAVNKDNQVQGFVIMAPHETIFDTTHKTIYMYGLYVTPAMRSSFLAATLISLVGEYLQGTSYTRGITSTMISNTRLTKLITSGGAWPYAISWVWTPEMGICYSEALARRGLPTRS